MVKIFLDTADIDEIREAASWGVLDGVTTNPTLVAKTGRKWSEVIQDILALVDGPISLEVTTTQADEMIKQGRQLAKLHKNVVVYVPRGVKHKAWGTLTVLVVCIPRGVLKDVHELE